MIKELECVCIINGREVLIEMVKNVHTSTYHILHNGDMKEHVTDEFVANILESVNQFKDEYRGFELFKRVFSVYCVYFI